MHRCSCGIARTAGRSAMSFCRQPRSLAKCWRFLRPTDCNYQPQSRPQQSKKCVPILLPICPCFGRRMSSEESRQQTQCVCCSKPGGPRLQPGPPASDRPPSSRPPTSRSTSGFYCVTFTTMVFTTKNNYSTSNLMGSPQSDGFRSTLINCLSDFDQDWRNCF